MTRRLAALVMSLMLAACGGESGPNGVEVGSISVTPNPVTLLQQQSVTLDVRVFDTEGERLSQFPVTFQAGDADLIAVSPEGKVQSLGSAGNTEVIVRAGTDSVVVPVAIGATGVTLEVLPSAMSMPQKGSAQLDPKLVDVVGEEIVGTVFSYFPKNPLIAQVSQTGLVRSVGPHGVTSITITGGGTAAEVVVTVVQVPTSITIDPNPVLIGVNISLQLEAHVRDAIGMPMSDQPITFSVEPSNILSISASGLLTAGGTPGTGSVTATSGQFSVTVPVTVANVVPLTGEIIGTAEAGARPYGVAVGSDGSFVGVGVEGVVHVGAFGEGAVESHVVSASVMTGIARHPTTGLVYATGSFNDALMEIDAATGTVLRRWTSEDQIYDVALSPDATRLFVAGSNGLVSVLSVASLTLLDEFQLEHPVVHLLPHPSQPFLYASGVGFVNEVNLQSGAIRVFSHPAAQATGLALSGDHLYVGGEFGQLADIELGTGFTTTVNVPCRIYDLVVGPDGRQLLSTCSHDGTALLIDAITLGVLRTIPVGGRPRRAAIQANGFWAVIANEEGWFTFVD